MNHQEHPQGTAWSEKAIVNHMETREDVERRLTKKLSKVNKKSAKEIMGGLTESALDAVLSILITKEAAIKKLTEIPELWNLKLTDAKFESGKIHLGFVLHDFEGNLRQLLLRNGYSEDNVKYHSPKKIRVTLYGASLIMFIERD